MDLWYFLMELVMLLAGAFILGALAQRLRQSPIIGYLLAGTIIGPLWFRKPAAAPFTYGEGASDEAPAVLVVGFGPAGRQVVDRLVAYQLQPLVLDVNPQGRRLAAQMGIPFYLGDAAREEILQHSGLERICLAVVTVPDPATSIRVVETLRRLRPRLPIAARCRYKIRLEDMRRAGADVVVDEETMVGGALAGEIVSFLQETSGTSLACRLSGRSPEDLPDPVQAVS